MAVLPTYLGGFDYLVAACLVALSTLFLSRKRKAAPYPPGPKGVPVLGNLLDVPEKWPWMTYAKWSQEYDSPILHLTILGTHFIIINDADTAHELLEKRSSIYADRPRMPMANEVAGFDWSWGFDHYGDFWRRCRRVFTSFFRESQSRQFRVQENEACHAFLRRLLDDPTNFLEHVHLSLGALMLDIGYGIKIESSDNKFHQLMEHALQILNATTDKNIVDPLPWIQHLPEWLPGMGWKRKSKHWRKQVHASKDEPYEHVKDSAKNGTARPSVSLSLLDGAAYLDGEITDNDIKSVSGALYLAGVDTSAAVLSTLFVILLAYPEVQQKAQEELDRVVGSDRLPSFSDKANLPYISAICLELLRWTCVAPLGIPRSNILDDVFETSNGKQCFIPKGSFILCNLWSMCYDSRVYSSPQRFWPERWLNKDLTRLNPDAKKPDVIFGFRSRVCPGRWAAEDTSFIMTASMLACFRVSPLDGKTWEMNYKDSFEPGLVIMPKPFKCSITPRRKEVVELIRQAESEF